jgi:uncharacterized protein YdhG (YjbR/CyaY superfamily)
MAVPGVKKTPPAKDIGEYLRGVPRGPRAVLQKLRRTIKEAAPEAEEGISYRIPVFKVHGPLVFFAAYEDHLSLFVPGKALVKRFSRELKGYYASGATIHFTAAKPLPPSLVKKIVKARVGQNLVRASVKGLKR